MRWVFYLLSACLLSAQTLQETEKLKKQAEEKHRLQKTSAILGTCPDGHPNLRDIPILYGLFGIQTKNPKNWNDDDKILAKKRDSHEVILGTDALVGGEPRFQPTCISCGYYYRVRSVPDEDAEWTKSGRKFSDFSTKFSSAAISLPFAELPNHSITVVVKEKSVVSELISITIPKSQRDQLVSRLRKWIAENHYQPSLLQVDVPLLEPYPIDSIPDIRTIANQTVEEGNAEFHIAVTTGESDANFTFYLTRKLPKKD